MKGPLKNLAAMLFIIASTNCFALTPDEIKDAQNKYAQVDAYYSQLKPGLEGDLKAAKKAKKEGTPFDYKKAARKDRIDELDRHFYTPLRNIHKKDTTDKTVAKLYEKATSKLKELHSLSRQILELQ
jgi:hypothetical protein